ncbi:MAG: GNAT family N-acetyltransferase [bacterium]|nr:GNAT family N-acetyltransferase [bacterium]
MTSHPLPTPGSPSCWPSPRYSTKGEGAIRGPEKLRASHNVEGFDCGDEVLNNWLQGRVLRNQIEGSSRTWVVTDNDVVVGYYASATAVLLRAEATGRAARNQPDPLPAMLLGRLAVDRAYQGKGLAKALLKHFLLKALEVSELTGLRLVLVHAKTPQAADFYRYRGFKPSPIDNLTLMLLIKRHPTLNQPAAVWRELPKVAFTSKSAPLRGTKTPNRKNENSSNLLLSYRLFREARTQGN